MLTRLVVESGANGRRRICTAVSVINGGHLKVSKPSHGYNVADARPLSTSSVLAIQSSGTTGQSAKTSQIDEGKSASPAKKAIARDAFITLLATRMDAPQKEAAEWLGAVQDLIAESLRGNNKVVFTKFGTFEAIRREYRVPPRSQLYPDSAPEDPTIPPRTVFRTRTHFHNGKGLLTYLNDPDSPMEGPYQPKKLVKKGGNVEEGGDVTPTTKGGAAVAIKKKVIPSKDST